MRYDNIYISEIKKQSHGFVRESYFSALKNLSYIPFVIPYEYIYRPDLIAFKFYGDPRYANELTMYNEFANSPEDYYYNRLIKIPNPKEIKNL